MSLVQENPEEADFVAVTGITLATSKVAAGAKLTLVSDVFPPTATNQTIVWAVKGAGEKEAEIEGITFTATAVGTATITATITNGLTASTHYTKEFTIEVSETVIVIPEVTTPDLLATAIAAGGTVTLGADITASIVVAEGKTVTLDLNGYTLTNKGITSPTISVEYGGTLTITDKSANGTGTVKSEMYDAAAVFNKAGGTVTIEKGNFERNEDTTNRDYVIFNQGTMNINGGKFSSPYDDSSSLVNNGYPSGTATNTPMLTIKGGDFDSVGLATIKNDDYGVLIIENGNFTSSKARVILNLHEATIEGGTFTAKENIKTIIENGNDGPNAIGKLTIEGGKFNGEIIVEENRLKTDESTIEISGDVTVNQGQEVRVGLNTTLTIAQDHTLTNNGTIINRGTIANNGTLNGNGTFINTGTGTVTVTGCGDLFGSEAFIAIIGDKQYTDLAQAITAAVSGDTIELIKNSTISSTIKIPSGVTLIIENGVTLTAEAGAIISGDGSLIVRKGGQAIISATHDGTTTKIDLPTIKTVTIIKGGKIMLNVAEARSLVEFIGDTDSARIKLTASSTTAVLTFAESYEGGSGSKPTMTINGNATIPAKQEWYTMYGVIGEDTIGIDMIQASGTLTVSGKLNVVSAHRSESSLTIKPNATVTVATGGSLNVSQLGTIINNGTLAGEGTLTAHAGSHLITFSPADITATGSTVYTGADIKPTVTIEESKQIKDKTFIINDKDYVVTYRNNKNVGTAEIVYTHNTNGTEIVKTFTITKGTGVANATISTFPITDITYGDTVEISFTPTVTKSSRSIGTAALIDTAELWHKPSRKQLDVKAVQEGTKLVFKVDTAGSARSALTGYFNDNSAATFDIKFGGTGNILAANYSVKETLRPKELTSDMIGKIANQTYTGKAIEPTLTVTDDNKIRESDYTVAYGVNNINVGPVTATLTVTEASNYKDVATNASKTFQITPATPNVHVAKSTEDNKYTATVTGLLSGDQQGNVEFYDGKTLIGESVNVTNSEAVTSTGVHDAGAGVTTIRAVFKSTNPNYNGAEGSFTFEEGKTPANPDPVTDMQAFTNTQETLAAVKFATVDGTDDAAGSWKWKDDSIKLVAGAAQKFNAVFTPANTSQYTSVERLITLNVSTVVFTNTPGVVELDLVDDMAKTPAHEVSTTGFSVTDGLTVKFEVDSRGVVVINGDKITAVAVGMETVHLNAYYDEEIIATQDILVTVSATSGAPAVVAPEKIEEMLKPENSILPKVEEDAKPENIVLTAIESAKVNLVADSMIAMDETAKKDLSKETIENLDTLFAAANIDKLTVEDEPTATTSGNQTSAPITGINISGLALAAGITSDALPAGSAKAKVEVTIEQTTPNPVAEAANVGKDALFTLAMDFEVSTNPEAVLASPLVISFNVPNASPLYAKDLMIEHRNSRDEIVNTLREGPEVTESAFTVVGQTVTMRVSSFSTFTLMTTDKPALTPSGGKFKPSSGGGGSSTATTPVKKTVTNATVTNDVSKAIESGKSSVTLKNVTTVTLANIEAAKAVAGLKPITMMVDTMVGGKIAARMYVDVNSALGIVSEINTTVKIDAIGTRKTFERFFVNDIAIASLGQKAPFGMNVKVAAKLDLSKLDTTKLIAYAYNKERNTFNRLPGIPFVDKNGFVHINTSLGGDIVVTDALLTRK